MRKVKRILASSLAAAILATSPMVSYGAKLYTMDQLVENGIEKSKELDEVELEIYLAEVAKDRGRYASKKLRRSERSLKSGSSQLSQAENAINAGILPEDVTLPDGTVLPGGTNINDLPLAPGVKEQIEAGAKEALKDASNKLSSGEKAMDQALKQAGVVIGSSLDFGSLGSLQADATANLLELMPAVSYEVTQASFDIYKNAIALLIQKSYYDVLQAERMVGVKEAALARGKKQYEFAKAAYEEGMKAKDDMLMAEVYYQATKLELEQAKGELENAKIELKKNANIDLGEDIELEDVMLDQTEEFDLEKGIESGMKNRLEIKKTTGEVLIYTTNFNETSRTYPSNTNQYKEAKLLQERAGVKFEQARTEVESSIRKSHQLTENTANMLNQTKGMLENAKENLKIAEAKYQEGYGVNTSLLSSLNLEASAGTIVEVLAAEEKLAEIEENIVKITYAYNLSRMQYKNNIGDFIY